MLAFPYSGYEHVSILMAMDFSFLLPPKGRPIAPDEPVPLPTTDELRVHSVAATAPILSVSGAILCLGVVLSLWSSVPHWILMAWAACTLLAMVPAPLLMHGFQSHVLSDEEAARYIRWIMGVSILRALAWGTGFAIFCHYVGPSELVLLGVLAVGNAMGTGAALISIPRAAITYGLCSVLPLSVSLMATGEVSLVAAGVLLIVYVLGLRSSAQQIFTFVKGEAELRKALVAKQEELVRARLDAESANKTKSDFLAHMSHELRTPLNAIIGFSEAISERHFGADPDRYAEYAGDINASGKHLLRVINDLLDLSKVEAGAFTVSEQPFDLAGALTSVEFLVRERMQRKRLTLTWDLPANLPSVTSDERIVQQILINVLTNAVKFTGEGGKVAVAVQYADAPDGLAISVTDTGIGMRPEDLAQALKPFGQVPQGMTVRGEGTGLGLPLCQRFAEALGGRFAIESELGKGTRVTLVLPGRCVGAPTSSAAAGR